jgi:Protein of unknown function (DUF3618)
VSDISRLGPEQQPVPDDPAALQRDIEETRERLEETVDEIGRRLDVKARMRSAAQDASQRANEMGQQLSAYGKSHPSTVARGVTVFIVATGLLLLVRRRRNR